MATPIYEKTTERRYYTVREYPPGAFIAEYRPINKKTGKPWQAWRYVPGGDCHYVKVELSGKWQFRAGDYPGELVNGVRKAATGHFSKLDLAIAAIKRDADKAGA